MSAMTTCTQSLRVALGAAHRAAISKASQAGGALRRIALKVGAREIVEEHFILRVKEVAPPLREVIKQRSLMHQQQVVACIKAVLLSEREIAPQQIRDRARIKPVPVQPPFGTRIDEAVEHERLQHEIPARALAAGRQMLAPEGIQAELPPQFATQPARTPLTRTAQRHPRQTEAHHGQLIARRFEGRMLLGEERDLLRRVLILVEEIDALAPGRLLAAVDLPAEMKK